VELLSQSADGRRWHVALGLVHEHEGGTRELVAPGHFTRDAGERVGPELVAAAGAAPLVVVGAPEPAAVRDVLDAGARGYLFSRPNAERPPAEDWTRVRTASGSVTELSAREIEVLQGVADGRTNGDIAADLQISPLTVKSHLARIGRKLGAGDRAQAVLLALRARVIT